MKTGLIIFGAMIFGIGLERGWLPGVGAPFWINLLIGAVALTVGLMLPEKSES